jgi:hypothetical protein
MTPEQRITAIAWLDTAFAGLQLTKLYLHGDPMVTQEEAADAVQHALARVAAARTLLVASGDDTEGSGT